MSDLGVELQRGPAESFLDGAPQVRAASHVYCNGLRVTQARLMKHSYL